MPSVSSGTVTNNIAGDQLTFTDTGAYTAPVTSRILTIFDPNGTLLATIDMGSSLTTVYPITADQYLSFVLNVTDATGPVTPSTVNYLAQGFYTVAYLNQLAQNGCGCAGSFCNLNVAELFLAAAQRFGVAGLGIASNVNIIRANVYVNMSLTSNLQ